MKNLRFMESAAFPALLLAACLVLLQAHAIPYWQARTGMVLGVVWSLALEAAALALIYRTGWPARVTGVALALVLVSVPLYQVAGPKLRDWQAADIRRERLIAAKPGAPADLAQVEKDIKQWKASHKTYVENSKTRLGWEERIAYAEKTIKEKETKRDKFKALIRAPLPESIPWWEAFAELLPALISLLMFQAGNVLSVRAISRYRHGISQGDGHGTHSPEAHAAGISEISGVPEAKLAQPNRPGMSPQSRATRAIADFGNSEIAPAGAPEIAGSEGGAISEITPGELPKSVSVSGGVNPRFDKFTLKRLYELVLSDLARPGINQKDFCARMGISTPDLTCFLAMFDRHKAGGRRPSRASVARLMANLLPAGMTSPTDI